MEADYFENLAISQGIVGRHWRFMASDNAGLSQAGADHRLLGRTRHRGADWRLRFGYPGDSVDLDGQHLRR